MTQILKTIYKDIRLTSISVVSSRRRASRLAETIASRYSKVQFQWPAVNLTLRQSQQAVVTHATNQQTHLHKQTHLHIRPHLSLTFAGGKDRAAESSTEQPMIIERIQETVLKPMLRHRIGEVMVERLVARQIRLNSLSTPGETRNISGAGDRAGSKPTVSQVPVSSPGDITVAVYREAAMPVTRHLRRNAIKQSSDSTDNAKAKQADVVHPAVVADRLSQQLSRQMPMTLSDQDMSRLTDQVVKTIDKRIIAARERVGRS